MKDFMNVFFPKGRKNREIREKAEELLYKLRDVKFMKLKDIKQFIGKRKTYYKIMRKLKAIKIIDVVKTQDGDFCAVLSLSGYQAFIKKNLLEDVKEVLEKKGDSEEKI